jgi:phosphomannomutase/phosphoglucomutase
LTVLHQAESVGQPSPEVRNALSLYKPHEISGCVDTELTPELYRSWGRTLGGQVPPRAKFVVGGDVRRQTPEFLAALVDGLAAAGADVVDLGILPTPVVYYAQRRLDAAGAAIVSSSYGAAGWHGLRWRLGRRWPTPEQVALLRREAEDPSPLGPDRKPALPRTLDISFDYVSWLQEAWIDAQAGELRVVLDPMYGCDSARARRYLQAVFPRSLFSAIHDRPDPGFGDRVPDCTDPHNLEELAITVEHERADLGIAFDGDGDRVAFVDNQGIVLTAEEAAWALIRSFGSQWPDRALVYDLKFSKGIPEAAEQLGAVPIEEGSGYARLHARMQASDALFGAGVRGHYFFGELGGDDDALWAACRLVAHLICSQGALADLRRSCPAAYITPDLRVALEPDEAAKALAKVRDAWKQRPQTQVDGVRIDFPNGWALVRPSVTEPALTFRFECGDWNGLYKLVWRFCDRLGPLGDAVWARYEEAMGHQCNPG